MSAWPYFYAYCKNKATGCNFFEWASSLDDAAKRIKEHEQQCHKGKEIGCFGQAMSKEVSKIMAPKGIKKINLDSHQDK